ncbi:MAG: FAD-dependent pyridine nucleotide-disulfide oxidoreductase, partial [Ignavibacteria bacterium]|nr:FAD-dependent pyridine nucleotide-disulfide oxidoreductase [Ignavibacteria bacterium]
MEGLGKQIVIIGGMAAGCKIASRLSRIRPDFNIIILEKGKYLSFSSCGLPLFASGELDNIDELNKTSYNTIRDINYFKDVKGITAYTNSEVISILPSEQTLSYKNLTNQEISELNYDYLVFATGSTHKKIPFPYHQSRRLSNFSKPEDALNFRQLAQKGLIKNAVIIGAGFIGCELAEAMISLWGIQTTILEKEDSILPGFLDKETSAI